MSLLTHCPAGAPGDARWLTAIAPNEDELGFLRDRTGFPSEVLKHTLDPNERPRVRTLGEFTLVVLRVPFLNGDGGVPYTTVPLSIVVGPRCGLTVAHRDGDVIEHLADFVEEGSAEERPYRVILRALELTAQSFLRLLDKIDAEVDRTEDRLGQSLENRAVLELLRYQKSLVYFSAALEGMYSMLDRMQKAEGFRVPPEDSEWLADVIAEFRQALDTSNLQRDVMSEMMDAFASIISNNLNVVMKFLAAVTVILTFPMLVASFYGMNVALPGQTSPHAFSSSIVASGVLCAVLAILFRRRGWL